MGLRVARWSARLLCFSYDVVYHPGKRNVTADCLSRLPLSATEEAEDEPDLVATVFVNQVHAVSLPEFNAACETCPELTQLRHQVQKGWPRSGKHVTDELVLYFNVPNELAVVDSLVMRGSDRLVVPMSLRSRVLDLAHEGHQGIVRTKQRLRELYWWPHMDKCVETLIGSCVPCQ